MSELLELAERCEKATGQVRELDFDIFQTAGGEAWDRAYRRAQSPCGCPHDMAVEEARYNAPQYTASIDAAMTLVPEYGWWAVAQRCSPTSVMRNFGSHNGIFRAEVGDWSDEWVAESDFPAIALCAAALRARVRAEPSSTSPDFSTPDAISVSR